MTWVLEMSDCRESASICRLFWVDSEGLRLVMMGLHLACQGFGLYCLFGDGKRSARLLSNRTGRRLVLYCYFGFSDILLCVSSLSGLCQSRKWMMTLSQFFQN